MIELQLARRYAEAFFQIASEGKKVDEFEKDLEKVCEQIRESDDLKNFLYNPVVSHKETKNVMETIFKKDLLPETMNLIRLLIDKSREKLIFLIREEFAKYKLIYQNIIEAEVFSAVQLKPEQKDRLHKKLEDYTGKKVLLTEKIDNSLIAGLKVRISDLVIEDTLDYRLKDMYGRIAKNG